MDHDYEDLFEHDQTNNGYESSAGRGRDRRAWDKRRQNKRRDERRQRENERGGF